MDLDFAAVGVGDFPRAREEFSEGEGDGQARCSNGFQPRMAVVLERDVGRKESRTFALEGMGDGCCELEFCISSVFDAFTECGAVQVAERGFPEGEDGAREAKQREESAQHGFLDARHGVG